MEKRFDVIALENPIMDFPLKKFQPFIHHLPVKQTL